MYAELTLTLEGYRYFAQDIGIEGQWKGQELLEGQGSESWLCQMDLRCWLEPWPDDCKRLNQHSRREDHKRRLNEQVGEVG